MGMYETLSRFFGGAGNAPQEPPAALGERIEAIASGLLSDPNPQLREILEQGAMPAGRVEHFAERLAALGAPAAFEISQLLLRPCDSCTQSLYIKAAAALGRDGVEALPGLMWAAANAENITNRHDAIKAIGSVGGPETPEAVTAIIDCLNRPSESWTTLLAAVETLPAFGEEARRAVPAAAKLLHSREPFVCMRTADTLAEIGGAEAKQALQDADARYTHPNLKAAVKAALEKLAAV